MCGQRQSRRGLWWRDARQPRQRVCGTMRAVDGVALLVRMNSRGKQKRTLPASVVARAFVTKRGKEEKMEREKQRHERDKDHGQNMKMQQQQTQSETLAALSVKSGYQATGADDTRFGIEGLFCFTHRHNHKLMRPRGYQRSICASIQQSTVFA